MKGPNRIIAISGKYDTGKDTLVNGLVQHYGACVHLKFADGLKEAVAAILHMPVENMYTTQGKSCVVPWLGDGTITVGRMQQLVGTILREQIDYDIWVAPVIAQAQDAPRGCMVLISDCRFPNELQAVHRADGIVIRLERCAAQQNANGRDPHHISETALDDCNEFDLVIHNNGTVQEMIAKAVEFIG